MTAEGTTQALFTYSHTTFTPLSNREEVKDLYQPIVWFEEFSICQSINVQNDIKSPALSHD